MRLTLCPIKLTKTDDIYQHVFLNNVVYKIFLVLFPTSPVHHSFMLGIGAEQATRF